ncbi:MAG: hypothetical protein JXB50_03560 [Spirochaetes bacterium]|nr:hypothetical protein [Spirochaetota bacterium]
MKEKNKNRIILEIEKNLLKILEENEYKLVDIDIIGGKRTNIIIYLYNKDKLDHEHLSDISSKIHPIVEGMIYFKNFLLEVSSPGLYRKLKSKHEFDIFIGKNIKLVNDRGNVITGVLTDFKNDMIYIKNNDKIINFNINEIKNASLNG